MAGVVTPLLELIAKHTGFTAVTLLCGAPSTDGEKDSTVAVVNYGTTAGPMPQDFQSFNVEDFRRVLSHWGRFVAATGEFIATVCGGYAYESFSSSCTYDRR